MKDKILVVVFFCACFFFLKGSIKSIAQNNKIDSLRALLLTDQADTNKVNHLHFLILEYINSGALDKAKRYADNELELAYQLDYHKGFIYTYYDLGFIYLNQSNYSQSINYFLKGLKTAENSNDKGWISEFKMKIGAIYRNQRDFKKASVFFNESLKIVEELGDKKETAKVFLEMGNLAWNQDSIAHALKYYFKTLQSANELGDKKLILFSFENIGAAYFNQKDFNKCIEYNFKALKIAEEVKAKLNKATCLISIGESYLEFKKYKEAESYMLQALRIDTTIGSLEYSKHTYDALSELYSAKGNYQKALEYYKKSIIIKDTLFNQEKNKEITRKEMTYEFTKKEETTKAENDKQQAIAEEKNRQQKNIIFLTTCGLLIVLILVGFVFRSLRITRKQKNTIELQKNQVSSQKEIVEKQKQIVEEKQKEIVDSINYAKRIQYTLLANDELLEQNLDSYFVLFEPKDIVSGDFYWATKVGERFYIAVCDSTGHGVPGAFMSLMNSSFLNEAIIEKRIEQPNEILNYVRKRLIESVSKDGAQDGMDGILVCFENGKVSYAAANNAPVVVRDGNIVNLTADKMPIGKGEKDIPFTLQTMELQQGETFYLYTDGYADQFGGEKGKKFKYKPLENLLVSIHQQPMQEQKELLKKFFENWKGNLEQVDDVLIMGIKL